MIEQRQPHHAGRSSSSVTAPLAGVEDDAPWTTRGNCRGKDPDMFFVTDVFDIHQAKEVCEGCPVRATCLDFAVDNGLEGIWGATTEAERRAIVRERGMRRSCVICGTGYTTKEQKRKYCSDKCRRAAYNATQPARLCVECGTAVSHKQHERCHRCSGRLVGGTRRRHA